MKKSIIAIQASNNTKLYVRRPFWYGYWREGRYRKRLGYNTTPQKSDAHKFIKRKIIRLIMNDIALRYKYRKPILIQFKNNE